MATLNAAPLCPKPARVRGWSSWSIFYGRLIDPMRYPTGPQAGRGEKVPPTARTGSSTTYVADAAFWGRVSAQGLTADGCLKDADCRAGRPATRGGNRRVVIQGGTPPAAARADHRPHTAAYSRCGGEVEMPSCRPGGRLPEAYWAFSLARMRASNTWRCAVRVGRVARSRSADGRHCGLLRPPRDGGATPSGSASSSGGRRAPVAVRLHRRRTSTRRP